jgi:hypothetical protein
MNDKDYIIKLKQKTKVLQTLLEDCQDVATNRGEKADRCFESKQKLQLEIKELKIQIHSNKKELYNGNTRNSNTLLSV